MHSQKRWHVRCPVMITWFFEQFVVGRNCGGYRPMDERFAYLFNSSYEGAGPRHGRDKRSASTTPPGHARATYRNFFPLAARWAFAGVRLAKDA